MGERQEFSNTQNWHNRGYLPHYEAANKYLMVTYRLADSLPQEVLKNGSAGVSPAYEELSLEERINYCKEIELHLDKVYGSCILKEPQNAQIVIDAWKFFDSKRYDLIAYVVMPNHVHILIKTYEGFALKDIVHSWKSFTSHKILKSLKEKNAGETPALPKSSVWQREYWDRFIRDEIHFQKCVAYILENPVKAGLVKNWQEWNWRFVRNSKG